jgi:uncharacterized protein DUF1552
MTIRTSKTALKFSRRAILKTLGLGAGFLPLLSTERARGAASSGFPRRLITITVTDGICPPDFYTDGAGALPATLPFTLQPLAPWAAKLLLLRQAKTQGSPIDCNVMMDIGAKYGGHFTYPALLTGAVSSPNGTDEVPTVTATQPSIDQLYANYLSESAGVSNALLNVGCRPYGTSTSWASNGVKNTPQSDPYKLFNTLFATSSMTAAQMNALLARRKSVLDFVGGELGKFATNLGTDDKVKVQSHLQAIQSLESQLTTMSGNTATCTPPTVTPTGLNFNTVTNYPAHVTFMSDIVAAAICCGKARAVTMDLIDNGGGNSLTFPWIDIPSPDMHAIAHQGSANYDQKSLIDQWFYQQCVAEVCKKLDAVTEGTGTVLDNTVILVMSDMSEGAEHYVGRLPYVIIGSGGFFKTGRTVTFASQVPNNQLLTSVLHALGMTDVTGVGDPKYTGNIDSALTT